MKKITFTHLVLLLIFGFGGLVNDISAQDLSPWTNNPYGNEWIDYSKKYVRVGVQANGLHKVSFATLSSRLGTGTTPAQIQLWHRGKEVAIISADNDWVVFYGEKNDGASDGLMFRPGPEARLNPYVSLFSEEGSYFFTTATNPLRATTSNGDPSGSSLTVEPYHLGKIIKKYDTYQNNAVQGGQTRENLVAGVAQQQFSFTTFGEGSSLNTSYYTTANAWVGPTIYGSGINKSPTFLDNAVELPKWRKEFGNPNLEILVNGLNTGFHDVEVFVSPSSSGLQDASKRILSMPFYGYGGEKRNVNLLLNTHISEEGTAQIRVTSKSVGNSLDWFGLSFFTVTYPKSTDMTGVTSSTFEFPVSSGSESLISIAGAVSGSKVYDLSNPELPVLINNANYDSQTSNLSFVRSRLSNRTLKILVVAPSVDATDLTTINSVNFDPYYAKTNIDPKTPSGAINPRAFEYLILTNDDSHSDPARRLKTGAKQYAENYRSLPEGGNYRTLVMDMRTIYDQFNYGEPSAIAIRRFVDYMIQDGKNENDNLLLIGHSVMLPVRIIKEMPGEVPTFGDPGSDILLVTGLKNSPSEDIPAIPVGRINAFTLTQLSDYLTKVKFYENETNTGTAEALDWRKKVLHIVGAKYAYELSQFKGIFSDISAHIDVTKREIITPLVSNDEWAVSNSVDAPTKTAPISGHVNNGVGMIAYYGHGNQTQTIYDLGNVSGGAFTNTNKFSFVYFNGCGVGNVFTSRAGHALSTNWLITPQRGAVAIFGNSYKSYVSPTQIYIDRLYAQIFEKSDYGNGARKTVGGILKDVASLTIDGNVSGRILASTDEISNIHQTNLYGDPALKVLIITPRSALPVGLMSFKASVINDTQIQLNWKTTWEKNNSHFIVERSYNGKDFEKIGYLEGKGTIDSESEYSFIDVKPHAGINYYRLEQVDIAGTSQEKTYSKIIAMSVPGSEAVLVYPNPTSDNALIQINVPVALRKWILWTAGGEKLKVGTTNEISLRNLPSGKYIVEIISESGDSYKKNILRK